MRTLTVLAVLAWATPAAAGRTHYGWLYGTEINPERGAEIETWLFEENGKPGEPAESGVWWGPTIGLSPHLELAVPLELAYEEDDLGEAVTELARVGVELRWRLDSPDPIEAGAVTTLVRVAVKRLVTERDAVRVEADVVLAYERGKLHAEVDVGLDAERAPDASEVELRPGAGMVYRVARELRIGAEAYGELNLHGAGVSWLAAGPTVAFTRGRFWMSTTFGIGLYQIDNAPRATFGIAF